MSAFESPLRHSARLGRLIRQDPPTTLGVSTQTLVEQAVDAGAWTDAAELVGYFWDEMWIIGQALFTWMTDIIAFRAELDGAASSTNPATLLRGIAEFDPSIGDRGRALGALAGHQPQAAVHTVELMRVRYASLHDAYVAWIQDLLAGISADHGEDAVFRCVERAYQSLWRRRYEDWNLMSSQERLQLSVEGMRGHLSGPRRRGDVGVIEEHDRYVMILDPCGSCGVLRRGDPDSERPPLNPTGNAQPHPWTWGRIGVGWYATHSPIVMEYLWMSAGRPPMRPLEGCDTAGPCRWFIYKDPDRTRPEHYERMGFAPPILE